MKKIFLILVTFLMSINNSWAIDNNTVEIVYNGSSATITIASNISSYVTIQSGNSSHVRLIQSETFSGVDATVNNEDGEIIYVLSGTSSDGEFYMEGAYKATVELNGLTLTNPSGAAIAVMNGKRIAVSAKKGTTNTLTDAANEVYNGCFHCKGHTKLKGKGTLNVVGNSKHAIYSKEYLEIKNLTLNITGAAKDAIHCKEYFLMESGTVNISKATEDGIQVELDGLTSTAATDTDHTDEDTGNFYMLDGSLTIANYGGKAIKTDGTITYSGGTRSFNTDDTEILSSIDYLPRQKGNTSDNIYDLQGRRYTGQTPRGILLRKQDGRYVKVLK